MNQQALLRKLRRAALNEAPQIGINRADALGGFHQVPFGADTMRLQLQEETDRRRDYLAEELLKIYIEGLGWDPARNHEAVATILAKSALAAATIIHPDLSEEAQDA